jgi:DNA-binding SARP family transcriptional activator
MDDLEVLVLGELQIRHGGQMLALGGVRQQCILAVLLVEPGRTVQRDQIVRWAWPDDPPDTAPDLVANYLSRLRKALEPAGERIRLISRPPGFAAVVDKGVQARLAAFEGE